MKEGVIVIGVNGLTKVALAILQKDGFMIYGILDHDQQLHNTQLGDIPILGSIADEQYTSLIGSACDVFTTLPTNKVKKQFASLLAEQYTTKPINAIHPATVIVHTALVGHGNLINDYVSIGPDIIVGNYCIIHPHVTIMQDTVIKDFVEIGAGSVLGAGSIIEEDVFIGPGSTIIGGVTIKKGASIGAGSVVLGNVKENDILLGNPAKSIKNK